MLTIMKTLIQILQGLRVFVDILTAQRQVSAVYAAVVCPFVCLSVCHRLVSRDRSAENMEKSQHTDFNKDMTNDSARVAYSNVRL